MKLGSYSKFVLFLIYLCKGEEVFHVSSQHWLNRQSLDEVDTTMSMSTEMLYIVAITVVYGPAQQVSYGQKACTGTLIQDDMVLTLASCVIYDEMFDPDPHTIKVLERPRGHVLTVLKINVHPGYYSADVGTRQASDLCLIVVTKSKQTNFPLIPQKWEDFEDLKPSCVMGGYGNDNAFDVLNFAIHNMNKTSVKLFQGRSCEGGESFCLHFPKIMPCGADYGTPLICDGVLYAVYTPKSAKLRRIEPHKCLDLYMSVFFPVYPMRNWIAGLSTNPAADLEILNDPKWILLLCVLVFAVMGAIYYGLVEFLQRTFDPAENLEQTNPFEDEVRDGDEYEDSWYDSQWVAR